MRLELYVYYLLCILIIFILMLCLIFNLILNLLNKFMYFINILF